MRRRHHEHQPVVPDHPAATPARRGRTLHEPDIGVAGPDPIGDGAAVADAELGRPGTGGLIRPGTGVGTSRPETGGLIGRWPAFGGEVDQPAGQQPLGDGQAGGHAQAHSLLLAQRGQAGVEFGRLVEQSSGPLDHDAAGPGQGRALRRAPDHRDAGLGLDGGDPRRHCLLGSPELGRGRLQAAGSGHRDQGFQRGQLGHALAEHLVVIPPQVVWVQGFIDTDRARSQAESDR